MIELFKNIINSNPPDADLLVFF